MNSLVSGKMFTPITVDKYYRDTGARRDAVRGDHKHAGVNFNFNLVGRGLVLDDYAPALGVGGGGLLVGKRVQEDVSMGEEKKVLSQSQGKIIIIIIIINIIQKWSIAV